MRTVALLVAGIVVGWSAAGVEWTRVAAAEDESAEAVPPLPVDPLMPEASLPKSEKALFADPAPRGPRPQPQDGLRRVYETRVTRDANGRERAVVVVRSVDANGAIVPEPTPGLVGRYQVSAYGSPNGHGCYVVDTMTGQTWQVANGQPPPEVAPPFAAASMPYPTEAPMMAVPDATYTSPLGTRTAPMARTMPPAYREPTTPVPQAREAE